MRMVEISIRVWRMAGQKGTLSGRRWCDWNGFGESVRVKSGW